ncbi:MAG: hypothetical protein K5767_01550 [Clostridia bacterium]|nr:hypothetical protein [Clostridia bacterium]
MAAVGLNFSDLTKDDIGKSLSYTVTWTDKDGNEQTTTAKLTFQGQGDGTIAAMDTGSTTAGKAGADDAKGVKNYFTDDQGNKYYLEKLTSASNVNASTTQVTGYRLTASSVQNAFKAGLENNEEFASNFEITKNANGSFTFETKATGAATATITGVSGGANFESKTIADNSKMAGWMAGNGVKDSGGGSITINREAADAMQKFDANKLDVITGTSTAEDIANKTFEVDGQKFVIADNSVTTEQLKGMDSDLHVIELGNGHGKGSIDNADTKKIAAEVQKATGRETEVYTAADNERNIGTSDVVFKDVNNKLKTKGNDLTLQIGDTADSYQQVNVKIQDMSSKGLGLKGLDLSTQESASKSIDTIKQAVNAVSSQRGQLGALQNRLDHTLNSLDATNQNITAAESQIRDTDMAKEMTQYSKNNILAQAAQSMLAQANSMPQGVLSLLG